MVGAITAQGSTGSTGSTGADPHYLSPSSRGVSSSTDKGAAEIWNAAEVVY